MPCRLSDEQPGWRGNIARTRDLLIVGDGREIEQPGLVQRSPGSCLGREAVIEEHQLFWSNWNAAAELRAGAMSEEKSQEVGTLFVLQPDDVPSESLV